jgi:hypothetical protein
LTIVPSLASHEKKWRVFAAFIKKENIKNFRTELNEDDYQLAFR